MAKVSYRARREAELSRRIARARKNLSRHAVLLAPGVKREGKARVRGRLGAALSLAVVCHVGVAYAALEASPACAKSTAKKPPERVHVRMVEAPKPVPAEPRVEAPRVEPVVEKPAVARTPRPKAEAPAKAQESKAPAPQPVSIVGLTLESTSASSAGPAFAVGDTLAGSTERLANAPRAEPVVAPPAPVAPVSRNQRVSTRPAAGVSVSPARRLGRVEPEYPSLLRHQNIEADVTVRVHLTREGNVERVELVRSAGQPPFDQAALEAAKKERFAPELHDGEPVATAITYTYRFRITQ